MKMLGTRTAKKWYKNGKKMGDYDGRRKLTYLARFFGDEPPLCPEPTGVVELSEDNFESSISSGIFVVNFFQLVCDNCNNLEPVWEELGKKYIGHKIIQIGKADCEFNIKLCTQKEVNRQEPSFSLQGRQKNV
jgi:thiol-disulfide isomerase/thioredoxin